MFELILWLALLPFLVGLTVADALTDRLPVFPLLAACLVAAAAAMWTADPGGRLTGGLVLAGVGMFLGTVRVLARRGSLRPHTAGAPRPELAPWWGDALAALCAGLVAGWGAAWAIVVAWLAATGAVAFYFGITGRTKELRQVSFLPFLTLGTILVFLLRLVPFA